jgi:hypothetical protein
MHMPAHQRGITLLVLIALVSVTIIFAYVSGLNRSASELARARELKTTIALAQAKEALIAYAVTYKDTHDDIGDLVDPTDDKYYVPGYLPCPDLGPASIVEEGVTAPSCGASLVSVMGRLPWRTLGLDALQDGSGECLWYAVSGTYKNNPNGVSGSTTTSNMMNWDTNGQFDVTDANGTTYLAGGSTALADTRAVAVIFAPGSRLSGQDRTVAAGTSACGGNYTAAAYLETANGINNSVVSGTAQAASTYIAGSGSDSFNDKLVYITRAEIWNAIKKRTDFNNYLGAMTRRAAECTARYGTHNGGINKKHLPWARDISLSASSIPTYAVNSRYNDTGGLMSGRLAYRVDNARGDTSNDLSSYNSNDYLFSSTSYCSYTPDQQIWYDNWKDQLFYAVAKDFKPSAWPASASCGTCLTINGGGSYAAVVIFAGEKLSDLSQIRNTASNKGSIANHLEGRNSTNNPNSGGNSNYQAAAASASFNDIVYAINGDLTLSCSDAGGVMRSVPDVAVAPPGSPTAVKDYADCQ